MSILNFYYNLMKVKDVNPNSDLTENGQRGNQTNGSPYRGALPNSGAELATSTTIDLLLQPSSSSFSTKSSYFSTAFEAQKFKEDHNKNQRPFTGKSAPSPEANAASILATEPETSSANSSSTVVQKFEQITVREVTPAQSSESQESLVIALPNSTSDQDDINSLSNPSLDIISQTKINASSTSLSQPHKTRRTIIHPPLNRLYSENPQREFWIMGRCWLCVSIPSSRLSLAESYFSQELYQAGLASTSVALSPSTNASRPPTTTITTNPNPTTKPPTPPSPQNLPANTTFGLASPTTIELSQIINLHLIRSCALLQCDQAVRGLAEADFALEIAERNGVHYMVCKSQLYRGLCLMELGRWGEASWAFTRSANVRGFGVRLGELKREAERRMRMEGMAREAEGEGRRG